MVDFHSLCIYIHTKIIYQLSLITVSPFHPPSLLKISFSPALPLPSFPTFNQQLSLSPSLYFLLYSLSSLFMLQYLLSLQSQPHSPSLIYLTKLPFYTQQRTGMFNIHSQVCVHTHLEGFTQNSYSLGPIRFFHVIIVYIASRCN